MPENLIWSVDSFENLDIYKLYKILHLRSAVFNLEQDCSYLDPDNNDQKALHIQGYVKDHLAVYCRIFRKGDYFDHASIGRVVADPKFRSNGYGNALIQKAIGCQQKYFNETYLTISAQMYLKRFYESHGFEQLGDTYLEDGIPHIKMNKTK